MRAEVSSKTQHQWIEQEEVWEALCKACTTDPDDWQTQRGDKVSWPTKDGDTAKDWFLRLYELHTLITKHDAIACDKCGEWGATDLDSLECQGCQGKWCDDCAERGPSKREVPCEQCPDFSKICCRECFLEEKTLRCECSDTDSWHSCCGRHGFRCERCDALLCDRCKKAHRSECPEGADEEDEEDEECPEGADEEDEDEEDEEG